MKKNLILSLLLLSTSAFSNTTADFVKQNVACDLFVALDNSKHKMTLDSSGFAYQAKVGTVDASITFRTPEAAIIRISDTSINQDVSVSTNFDEDNRLQVTSTL